MMNTTTMTTCSATILDSCMNGLYLGDHSWWFDILQCSSSSLICLQQWNTVHIVALIPTIGSIFCSFYIIVTGIHYHTLLNKLNLRFTAQLPVCISICDLVFNLNHGSDHIHNILTGYVSEGWLCQFFGCLKPFSINCQTAWVLGTAFFLSYTIIKAKEPSFGQYNLKIHIPCWGIPFTIMVIGFGYNVYRIEWAWCGIKDPLVYVNLFLFCFV